MRKADIEKLAKRKRNEQPTKSPGGTIAPDAQEAAQEREEAGAVNLTPETCRALGEAVAVAICARLAKMLPIMARVAAADTLRSCQQRETIFKHAIDEGKFVALMLKAAEEGMKP